MKRYRRCTCCDVCFPVTNVQKHKQTNNNSLWPGFNYTKWNIRANEVTAADLTRNKNVSIFKICNSREVHKQD